MILSVIGLLAAIWVWQNVHPLAGLVVGFLFVGGLGWKVLGAGLNLLKPSARKAYGPEGREFIAAWEERFGTLSPGSRNHPPPGTFQAWLRDNRRTGIRPGAWIDMKTNPNPFDAGFETYAREMANRIPAPGTVEGRCEVLADGDIPGIPRDIFFLAERGRLVLRVLRNAGEVAVLSWDDIYSWTRMGESVHGEGAWELTLDQGANLPDSVHGLLIREITDVDAWEDLLEEMMPFDLPDE